MDPAEVEEWRTCLSNSNYEVSNLGRVRRAKPGPGTFPGRLLKPALSTPMNYQFVVLSHGGRRKGKQVTSRTVHSLVAETFLGPPPPGHVVRHLDGNSSNNHLTNIAYGTPSQNQRDRIAHGNHHNAAKTHCIAGHEFTPENTRVRGGTRKCRTCDRERATNKRRRLKEANK